jgi:hypothetical protein
MADRRLTRRTSLFVAACWNVAASLLLPATLYAQSKGTISSNPVNPLGLPIQIVHYPHPVHYGVGPVNNAGPLSELQPNEKEFEPAPPNPEETPEWIFCLSASYQFLDVRSRIGGLSLDSDSGILDLTISKNSPPYTCFDLSYIYSHGSGSAPIGATQTENQNVGSLFVYQPIFPCPWDENGHHNLSTDPQTNEWALIFTSGYGRSIGATQATGFQTIQSSASTYEGSALLDYQGGWFSNRNKLEVDASGKRIIDRNYPCVLVEVSTGIQFDTTRFNASATSTSSRQLTYRTSGYAIYSFPCRLGFLVGAEWDAPLDSVPLRGSRPYYANIAVFSAGLTYNAYQNKRGRNSDSSDCHWSMSLLYSYTAFDPLTETNQIQAQVSYRF